MQYNEDQMAYLDVTDPPPPPPTLLMKYTAL